MLVVLGLAMAACQRSTPLPEPSQPVPAERRFPLTGVVLGGPDAAGTLTVGHDAVGGFMPAMVMPLEARDLPSVIGLDDRISATLVVTPERTWIEDVVVTRTAGAARSALRVSRAAPVGATLPNFRLRDQDDELMTMQGLRGRVVLVTFIYTRCPLPEYCPRLMSQFAAIRRELAKRPEVWRLVELLSVTIDPAFDTPAVLREYGQRMIGGPAPFNQWTLATGEEPEIQAMAAFLGLEYRPESGTIAHTLQTAVIGADGRVAALFPSNSWPAEAVVRAIAAEAERAVAR